MSSERPTTNLETSGIDRAKEILTTEPDNVVRNIMELLVASQEKTSWQTKHTASTLNIFEKQIQNNHEIQMAGIESKERVASQRWFPVLIGVASACAIGLSWLFLAYEQPQYVAAVITAVAGFMGGYGLANSKQKK